MTHVKNVVQGDGTDPGEEGAVGAHLGRDGGHDGRGVDHEKLEHADTTTLEKGVTGEGPSLYQ